MLRFLFVVSCLFIAIPNTYAQSSACTKHHCIGVIDAGSTGSRLHVFSYDLDETNTAVGINEIWFKKITPGFATIETQKNTIDNYLTLLFSGAPIHHVPVYFYATAGMRLLPETKQETYYQHVQNWFDKHPEMTLVHARTITGEEEALYDWLSVNYHLGTLDSSKNESIGVVDIGGASVQIVFPIQKNSGQDSKSEVELTLYNKPIRLFVHSFLGLGQNEISRQLLDTTSCFAQGYPLPDGDFGQGDALLCEQNIAALINDTHKVNNEIQPILASNSVNSWYAIGGLANLVESKPFTFQNNQMTSEDLLQQANNLICEQQWGSLNTNYPNNEHIDLYCLFPAFYYALMVDGYGLSANQPIHYIPSSQNLDWTLGVVFHH